MTLHAASSGLRPGPFAKLATAAGDIKLAHSVFALPFAVLAAFLAGPGSTQAGVSADQATASSWPRFAGQLLLIVVCMVLARTWAMLVNRVADRRLDADNPRTARRAFASGRLSVRDGLAMLALCAVGFAAACSLFGVLFGNWWPAWGAFPVLAWIALYSFTKRFTALCHLFLGSALATSPVAAAAAIDPASLASPTIWLLAVMVLLWVAGFDVIYALQDLDHDRSAGLHSVPARLGPGGAIWTSRALHLVSFAALVGAWQSQPGLGALFLVGVALTGALLVTEHVVLARRGKAGLDMAFFTLNGVISVVLGLTGVVDSVL
ncbi:MAG: 4-hydroxybenzoate octaprenyltransferase [Phycisphaeraceae bacterium]|nr:MAG: 4-hydroxybenzoate octaprenyltransferase [Phycisphaeraceae bacterium]